MILKIVVLPRERVIQCCSFDAQIKRKAKSAAYFSKSLQSEIRSSDSLFRYKTQIPRDSEYTGRLNDHDTCATAR